MKYLINLVNNLLISLFKSEPKFSSYAWNFGCLLFLNIKIQMKNISIHIGIFFKQNG